MVSLWTSSRATCQTFTQGYKVFWLMGKRTVSCQEMIYALLLPNNTQQHFNRIGKNVHGSACYMNFSSCETQLLPDESVFVFHGFTLSIRFSFMHIGSVRQLNELGQGTWGLYSFDYTEVGYIMSRGASPFLYKYLTVVLNSIL